MLKREAHGLMDDLVEAVSQDVLPFGTELYLIKRGGDHGIRIDYEGASVSYYKSEDLAKFMRTYVDKLRGVMDSDRPLLELLMPQDPRDPRSQN